jgi:type IV secretory pathway TraG/TraD family ATPase VirD4
MSVLAQYWDRVIDFALWATQGRRFLVTLGVVALVFAWGGLKLKGGGQFRHYVLILATTPFLVIAGMLVGWAVDTLLTAVGVAELPVRQTVTFSLFPMVAFAIGYATATGEGGPAHERGALVSNSRAALQATRKWRKQNPYGLTLAGIGFGTADETKHFKMIGTTGTGKSTAIRELLGGALRRGDRAVIADPDAGYLGRFYDPSRGDVILNPFDPRGRRWDLFRELRSPYDYDQLARSLIGAGEGSDRSWRQYAQVFFSSTLRQLHQAGVTDIGQLYRMLTIAPVEELKILLDGTPARPFLDEGNERMFGSIRSVTAVAVAPLDYIQGQNTLPFSIRDWVQGGQGVLFLPYQADQIAALRSVISTWMRIAIFQTMSQGEGDHRLWFVVDELDALGPIDGLKDALARLRKFGGRCVLGFQSIAQVRGTYGDAESQTIVENCGTTLILRCSASEGGGTAQFASKLIGDRQIVRIEVSHSRSDSILVDPHSSTTEGQKHVTEAAVMPSEIEQLPDLEGLLKFASSPQWLRVRLG